MTNIYSNFGQMRVADPVLTQVIHGYGNAQMISDFIAPVVNVPTRAGLVMRFGKENFAVTETGRAPTSKIKRVSATFSSDAYNIEQNALGAEVPIEHYEEALNGAARLNLRTLSALRAAEQLQQSWEAKVISQVYDATKYETTNVINAAGAVTDFDALIQDAQEVIRGQIGRYANSAIISSNVARYLKRNAGYRDRIKYTSSGSINTELVANWWDLGRGVRTAMRQKLNPDGTLTDMVPAGTILLFYNPEGAVGNGFLPVPGSDRATPAFAYTYNLEGYPVAEAERYDPETRTFLTDIILEQSIQLVGLGATGKVGAGVLITGITG